MKYPVATFMSVVLVATAVAGSAGPRHEDSGYVFHDYAIGATSHALLAIGRVVDNVEGDEAWQAGRGLNSSWDVAAVEGNRVSIRGGRSFFSTQPGCHGDEILTVVEAEDAVLVRYGEEIVQLPAGYGCTLEDSRHGMFFEHPGSRRLIEMSGYADTVRNSCVYDDSCRDPDPDLRYYREPAVVTELNTRISTERVWIDAHSISALFAAREVDRVTVVPRNPELAAGYCQIGYRVTARTPRPNRAPSVVIELFGLEQPLGSSRCAPSDGPRQVYLPPMASHYDHVRQPEILVR